MKDEKEVITYRVVIKTNALASSFYEELCAFVTGQVSEIDSSNSRRFRAPAEVRAMTNIGVLYIHVQTQIHLSCILKKNQHLKL